MNYVISVIFYKLTAFHISDTSHIQLIHLLLGSWSNYLSWHHMPRKRSLPNGILLNRFEHLNFYFKDFYYAFLKNHLIISMLYNFISSALATHKLY